MEIIKDLYDEYIHKTEFIREKLLPKFIKNIWLKFYIHNIYDKVETKLIEDGLFIGELKWIIHYFRNENNGIIKLNSERHSIIECRLSESTFNGYIDHTLLIECINESNIKKVKYQVDIYTKKDNSVEVRLSVMDYNCSKFTTVKISGNDNTSLEINDINKLTVANKTHYVTEDIYSIIGNIIMHLILNDTYILRS